MPDPHLQKVIKEFSELARAMRAFTAERKTESAWLRKCHGELVTKTDLRKLERKIVMTQTELAAGLTELQTQIANIAAEQAARSDAHLAKIAELEALIVAGGDITLEVLTAFTGVKDTAQALDDVIPNPPTPQQRRK